MINSIKILDFELLVANLINNDSIEKWDSNIFLHIVLFPEYNLPSKGRMDNIKIIILSTPNSFRARPRSLDFKL